MDRNILSFLTVEWITALVVKGTKKPLEAEDLFELPVAEKAETLCHILDPAWAEFRAASAAAAASAKQATKPSAAADTHAATPSDPPGTPQFSFVKPLTRHFGPAFAVCVVSEAIFLAATLSIPTFIREMILYLTPGVDPSTLILSPGLLTACLFGLQVVASFASSTRNQIIRILQLDFQSVLLSAVYEKSLRLSQSSQKEYNEGRIINLANVDTNLLSMVLMSVLPLLSAPIHITIAFVLIGQLLGLSVWAAAGVIFVCLLAQLALLGLIVTKQTAFLVFNDSRIRLIRETLYGMKVIKFRALEQVFMDRIVHVRNDQMRLLRSICLLLIALIGLYQIAPMIMPIAGFIVFAATGGLVDAAVIFPALALFTQLWDPFILLAESVPQFAMAVASFRRLSAFFNAEERAPTQSPDTTAVLDESTAIRLQDANFEWPAASAEQPKTSSGKSSSTDSATKSIIVVDESARQEHVELAKLPSATTLGDDQLSDTASKPFFLSNLSISIPKGQLVAVVGPVGSGKSSLLAALTGDMVLESGRFSVAGSVGFCAQQPWILTETIKGNILFGNALDEDRMANVVQICGLQKDLDMLPRGIDTQIGEKGVNLSGGQKARIALARALYIQPDIALLDDPIAALDAHVGAQVFQSAIKEHLASKTVLLVTHQLHLLPQVDSVVVMHQGRIVEYGAFADLMRIEDGHLSRMMRNHQLDDSDEDGSESGKDGDANQGTVRRRRHAKDGKQPNEVAKEKVKVEDDSKGILDDEERITGRVQPSTYKSYIKAAGGASYVAISIVAFVGTVATRSATDLWLAFWTGDTYGLTQRQYLDWYSGIGAMQAVVAVAFNAIILLGGLKASRIFHNSALTSLMEAPMRFFDSQPIGRILNRLSKDVEVVDNQLASTIFLVLYGSCMFVSELILIIYASSFMLILLAALLVIYFFLFRAFQQSNRELRRLMSIERSPLLSHISETLSGTTTIRACSAQDRFIVRMRSLLDSSNKPSYLKFMVEMWLRLRLELLSALIVLLLALLGNMRLVSASAIGLALTYASSLVGTLNLMLQGFANLEAEFNTVERLNYYVAELPKEAARETDRDLPEGQWPTKGAISIQDLEIRYESRPDYAVLRDLSLDILPGENVGIVGRTGSGKSTLMTALFRIVEPSKGTITIDGQDICQLGLKTLRSRLQIIPQEPVLFTGTVRANLDVESKYTDADVWDVLERIGLKDYVSSLPDKLESPVTENGENLSVGQRQLICLGRAILMKPVVLIMDEATASVDAEADKLIQESIKTNFKHTTVLSIAHRLNTIADFDRVLVLQDGVKVEFDTPHVLLNRPQSLFSQLADATGPANAQLLRDIAANKAAASASL